MARGRGGRKMTIHEQAVSAARRALGARANPNDPAFTFAVRMWLAGYRSREYEVQRRRKELKGLFPRVVR